MARTQLRLDAVTGSLVAIEGAVKAAGVPAAGAAEHLEDVLGHFAGAIKRITGAPTFTEQAAGQFSHALTGSAGMMLGGDLDVSGSVNMQATLAVAGKADFAGIVDVAGALSASEIKVDGDVAGRLYRVGSDGQLVDEQDLTFNPTGGTGSTPLLTVAGGVQAANLVATTAGIFASAKVQDLTGTHVVFVGVGGALTGSGEMTFGAGGLTLIKDLSARSGSFSGDLTISGDLVVQGNTVTVEASTLVVEDKNIELGKVPEPTDITADNGGITLRGATDKTITWSNTSKYWEFSEGVKAPSGTFYNLANKLVKADANGKLLDADAMDFITGSANQVILTAGALGGSVVLSLPQSIDVNADVEFDTLKLGDLASDHVGKALKVGADGAVVQAAWNEFFTVQADVGLSIAQEGFKVALSQSQDLRSSASPQFAALNIGTVHDILADGGNLKVMTTGELLLSGADGQYALAESGDRAAFVTAFGASETIIGAINALAAGSGGGKGKWSKLFVSAPSPDASIADMASAMGAAVFPSDLTRVDVYLNGQLMTTVEDYAISTGGASVDFTFDLKADDVVTVIIR